MVIKNRDFTRSEKVALSCLIAFLLLICLSNCTTDTSGPVVTTTKPTAVLTGYSGCLSSPALRPEDDCLEYEYTSDGTLLIQHTGAGFNCCPGEIYAEISIEEDQIVIVEDEKESGCGCLCLFTVDYEVTNLGPGKYEIWVIEPYVTEEDDSLVCTIDLGDSPSGSCCVSRNHYPWQ